MTAERPCIATIVEGHGEVGAVPPLLRSIAGKICGRWDIDVPQPFRLDSGKMSKPDELEKAVRFQAARVGRGGIIVLRDGDDADCPVELATEIAPDPSIVPVPVHVVIAHREFEAWFLAGLESLRAHRAIRDDAVAPAKPERRRDAKALLEQSMTEAYRETRHQPAFAALLDPAAAFIASRSFRRLVDCTRMLLTPR